MTDPASCDYASVAAYELHDRGDPHLVVLLHGLGGDRNQPLGLTKDRLAGLGVSVLAPDARAHGETDLVGEPDRFTTANLAQDVLALVDHLDLTSRALIPVGISMGAAVGLQMVTHHPQRVAGAVLIRPSFGAQPWPRHLLIFRLVSALLRTHGPAGLDVFLQSPEYNEVQSESASAAASLREQFTKPRAVERVVRLETVPGNTAAEWPDPHGPALPMTIIGAQADPAHPLAVAKQWHQQLSGSDMVEVPSRDADPEAYAAGMDQATTAAVRAILRVTATT